MLQFSDEAARKLEAIYSSADVVAQRRAMLDRLSLRPGESVIEYRLWPRFSLRGDGCCRRRDGNGGWRRHLRGPGRLRSRQKCSWLTYQHGDARALNVPDASFDVAASVEIAFERQRRGLEIQNHAARREESDRSVAFAP